MPHLSILGLDGLEFSYLLERDVTRIGRAAASDVVVDDARASRHHAEVRRQGTSWFLHDAGSGNGTLRNGIPVVRPVALEEGDRIEIGAAVLLFHSEAGSLHSSRQESTDLTRGERVLPGPAREAVLVGRSAAMNEVRKGIERLAAAPASVLLRGESGTGKELAAQLIHRLSPRSKRPYEVVNCPALPASLLEAELFGVERGAATGVSARIGKLERANGGTVFLDEVGDLGLPFQAKLLRFLEDRIVERIGGRRGVRLDVRIIAATNLDIEEAMRSGAFRRDLYHRLNVVTLRLPPLRERREDIPDLVDHFLARQPGERKTMTASALDLLCRLGYPGNVRELAHIVESAAIHAGGPVIELRHLPDATRGARPADTTAAAPGTATGTDLKGDELRRRLVEGGESFWKVLRDPYVARQLDREAVRAFFLGLYREAGGSHKRAAEILRVGDDYKRFLDFVRYHRLRVRDLLLDPRERR